MFMLYYLTDDLNTYGTTCKTPLICSYSTPAHLLLAISDLTSSLRIPTYGY